MIDPAGLSAGRFLDVEWSPQTGSTNEDLKRVAAEAPAQPAVRITDEQTEGRGRRDRAWTMPPGGGVLMSLYVPWTDVQTLNAVPTALGVAAIGAIETTLGQMSAKPMLKWPNDLIMRAGDRDRKFGGMLSEIVSSPANEPFGIVCGIGINVTWPNENDIEQHPELANAAALGSVAESVDRVALAAGIIDGFDRELTSLVEAGPAPILERYRTHCATIGSQVRVVIGGDDEADVTGIATDIDPTGALLVQADGALQRFEVGDVVHLRSAGRS